MSWRTGALSQKKPMPTINGNQIEFNPLLEEAAEFLFRKFRNAPQYLYRIHPATKRVIQFPGKVRGNSAYRASRVERIKGIQSAVNASVKTEFAETKSNTAFVTLTVPNPLFQPDTLNRLADDWSSANVYRDRFFKQIRRRGVKSYVYSVEATGRGGFHIHALLIFDHMLRGFVHTDGSWRSDEARTLCQRYWPHLVDVKLVRDGEGSQYVTKELYKVGGAERPLKKWSKGEALTLSEEKTILTFALAHRANVRLLSTSRDITEGIPDEDDAENYDERLDKERNNAPEGWVVLAFFNHEIRKAIGERPPPFTGELEPNTPLWEFLIAKATEIANHYEGPSA